MKILSGPRVLLRPGREEDAEVLARILGEPAIAERWGGFSVEEVLEDFVGSDEFRVIEVDGVPVGGIQWHEEEDPMYRHAGIDIFLDPAHHGRSLGTEAIRVLARYLLYERGHHRLTIDPAADNLPAIRAYGRVGFKPVGIMRRYERGPDGVWHDGLLMDMLVDEFQDDAWTNGQEEK
jgi:aminoglycoside 6'-N-acetyltransferase